jgi:sugar (pentulose or hexulose) kinase
LNISNGGELFTKLFEHSLKSDGDVGGIVSYNFLAGEPLAGTEKGAPMVVRSQSGNMNLANFMQSQIYSAIETIALGMDILKAEEVKIDSVLAHGGYYKTPFVGQNATSAIFEAPVTVLKTAAEGGAWGMALLALYATESEKTLKEFLDGIFTDAEKTVVTATEEEVAKFKTFMKGYRGGLQGEKLISEAL